MTRELLVAEGLSERPRGWMSRRSLSHVLPLLCISLASSVAGCGSDCKSYGSAGLGIRVEDAKGEAVCDASVNIRDGDYAEMLQVTEPTDSEPCTFYGAYERPGSYTISIEVAGSNPVVKKATVDSGSCRVDLNRLTIQL